VPTYYPIISIFFWGEKTTFFGLCVGRKKKKKKNFFYFSPTQNKKKKTFLIKK